MVACEGERKPWATTGDEWEAHKEVIRDLYFDQGKPLGTVMEIMRREHNFHATKKMYKYRLAKWGFRKNLRRTEAQDAWHKVATGRRPELPIIQGCQLGSKKLKAEMKRINAAQCHLQGDSKSKARPRLASPKSLTAPDEFRTLEGALQSINTYTLGNIKNGTWPYAGVGARRSNVMLWWNDVRLIASELTKQPGSASVFARLDKCYGQYRSLMQKEEFPLMTCTYMAILRFLEVDTGLARSLITYVANLSSICFGPSHPLTHHWSQFKNLKMSTIRLAMTSILQTQLTAAHAHAKPGGRLWLTLTLGSFRYLYQRGLVGAKEATELFAEVMSGNVQDSSYPEKYHNQYYLRWLPSFTASFLAPTTETPKKPEFFPSCQDVPLRILEEWFRSNQSSGQLQPQQDLCLDVITLLGILDGIWSDDQGSERHIKVAFELLREKMPQGHGRLSDAYAALGQIRMSKAIVKVESPASSEQKAANCCIPEVRNC